LGSALATLGLLGSCRWDNDDIYHLARIGTYLRADSILYYLPAGGSPIPLQTCLSMKADGHQVAVLSTDKQTLSYYTPGSMAPTQHSSLPFPGQTVAAKPDMKGFFIGGPQGLWATTSEERLTELTKTPALSLLPSTGFVLQLVSATHLMAAHPQKPSLTLAELRLPGPLINWWAEPPLGAAGIFFYRDTLYRFSYRADARHFAIDTISPTAQYYAAASPYLVKRTGTEYTGTVTLSVQRTLSPLGLAQVQAFAVDFLGGWLYCVQRDTLWEYALPQGASRPLIAPLSAYTLEVCGVYRYGRANITTR
jgi:hypothetical protein